VPHKPRVVFDQAWATTPSARYGALDRDACHAELKARGVVFTVVPEARGVEAPVRLPKDVAGVVWRTELPAADRAHAPWDVVDCRVVLSLHDWGPRLRGRGVTEVLLFSAWRPPPRTWPAGKPATRHPGALAIDVKRIVREPDPVTGAPRPDLDVDRDWDPRLGAPPCGAGAPPPSPPTAEAAELRALACEADDARLFTVMLTPHYDHAHANHLHMEITPGVTWRLTR
jgi:hypothetical protein